MATPIELVVDSLPRNRRMRRVRPARFPRGIERRFVNEQRKLVQQLGAIVGQLLIPRLGEIARLGGFRADDVRYDQSPWRALLREIFGQMRDRWEFASGQAESIAEDTGNQISLHNRQQIARQLRAAVGVDVFAADPELLDLLEQFTQDNVAQITTVSETVFPALERTISNGYRSGIRASDIADQIVRQLGVAESRAAFWARDQIGSLNGQLTRSRQKALGIGEYVWRTSLDERVRETHRQLEGTVQSWDDPPTVGGRQVHPGFDFNCRCTADLVIPGDENVQTSPSDVPRDPELVKRFRARSRRRRERGAKRRLTQGETP